MDRLYKKLEAYGNQISIPSTCRDIREIPVCGRDFSVQQDITEINGFDNLHHPETILKELLVKNAARLYQVQESFSVSMEAPGQFWQPYLLL